jgi:hypothetical protein
MNADAPSKLKSYSYQFPDAAPFRFRNKTPRGSLEPRGEDSFASFRVGYFANKYFAVCALARDAAFLCTTPDLTALSIAET